MKPNLLTHIQLFWKKTNEFTNLKSKNRFQILHEFWGFSVNETVTIAGHESDNPCYSRKEGKRYKSRKEGNTKFTSRLDFTTLSAHPCGLLFLFEFRDSTKGTPQNHATFLIQWPCEIAPSLIGKSHHFSSNLNELSFRWACGDLKKRPLAKRFMQGSGTSSAIIFQPSHGHRKWLSHVHFLPCEQKPMDTL